MYKYIYLSCIFSLNHLIVLGIPCSFIPKYSIVYVLNTKNSLTKFNVVMNTGNLSLVLYYYLICSLYSNFINYFNSILIAIFSLV